MPEKLICPNCQGEQKKVTREVSIDGLTIGTDIVKECKRCGCYQTYKESEYLTTGLISYPRRRKYY